MKDEDKTKGQLLNELQALRRRVIELEVADAQLRQALEECRKKVRILFEGAPVGIGVADLEGNVLDGNRCMEELTGYTLEELRRVRLGDTHVNPDDRKLLLSALEERGQVRDFEVKLKRKDGTVYTALLNVDLVEVGGRKLLVTTKRDITEHKQAEEELCRREQKYRTLLENLPQKIFFKNRDSVYVSCNENYARIFHMKADEVSGKTDYDFSPKELAEVYIAEDRRVMESGKAEDMEEEYVRDGQRAFVHKVKTPVKDENGNVVGVLGIFWDITERKRLEKAVLEIGERERRRIGQDLHDGLGQQLTGIALMAKVLERKLAAKSSPEAEGAAEIAKLVGTGGWSHTVSGQGSQSCSG